MQNALQKKISKNAARDLKEELNVHTTTKEITPKNVVEPDKKIIPKRRKRPECDLRIL
jgi:hypothetical protein